MKRATTPLYTEDQLDQLDAMERAWLKTVPQYKTIKEVMTDFPESKTHAIRMTRTYIKELKRSETSLTELRDVWSLAINKMKPVQQPGFIDWLDEHIARKQEEIDTEMKKYKRDLNYLLTIGKEEELSEKNGGVTEDMVARAKSVPPSALLKVNSAKKALCLWHSDTRASMQVYKDHVYCFVCEKHGDVIDVYREQNGCDFITAVKALCNV